nr:hypothetical protein [Tanacetum cinerariifolium]
MWNEYLNEECLNCVYENGKPLTCNKCGGMLRGGFCFPCNLEAENSYNCYQDAYSFNYTSNNSNYCPQPQYENYLCNLCGNNSHDGYDCQQQFPFVYEQEPSYNQNYNDNHYPHDLPSFTCCDNCGGSHETFQCQPMDQNIDFFGSDQIQTAQYPDVHLPSQEKNLKELAEYKESLENSSKEIVVSSSNQEKEEPAQDSDIHKEFLCIHDNVDDLIESALNSKLLLINSQHLDNKEQEVKNERLIYVVKNNISDDSSNDPLLEEADLFHAFDNSIPPGIENFVDDSEGDIHFLEELLIDDSILSHESSDSNFEDNPSIPRPPPEPPDAETDAGEEIPVVINDKDKFDEYYYFFMFAKVFSLLSVESEDTIFDPRISV